MYNLGKGATSKDPYNFSMGSTSTSKGGASKDPYSFDMGSTNTKATPTSTTSKQAK
jgi:hypothetical protein